MSCRGVHFSLNDEEVGCLRSLPEAQRWQHVSDVIEQDYFNHHAERLAESDKAWDAIHRALTDGRLACAEATHPLNLVVLGGEQLHGGSDYLLSLKTPQQVRDVAPMLSAVTAEDFKRRYFAIDADDYGLDLDDVDCAYSWDWFENIRDFWVKAAAEGRWVLFSVDQ